MGSALKYTVVEKRWVNRAMHSGYEVVSEQEIITNDFDKVAQLAELTVTDNTDVFVYGYDYTDVWKHNPPAHVLLVVEAR